MDTLTTSAYRLISNHVFAERRQKISNDQNALFATQSFSPGQMIADFSAGTYNRLIKRMLKLDCPSCKIQDHKHHRCYSGPEPRCIVICPCQWVFGVVPLDVAGNVKVAESG